MTSASTTPERTGLPGRHVETGKVGGWLTRRLNPAAFMQSMLIVCVILILWPSTFGGRFGMVMVAGHSMEPTYDLGDAVIAWKEPVEIGDVILYRIPEGEFGERNAVIHRVVGGDGSGWVTQGDNTPQPDQWKPANSDVLGVAKFRVPLGGDVLAVLSSWLFISIIGGVAALLLFWPDPEAELRRKGRHRA